MKKNTLSQIIHYICTYKLSCMANTKNGALREAIIDRCLRSRRGFSTQEILDRCNDALEQRGDMPVSATNTIRNDILSIENRFCIIVEQVRVGREIRYRYKDPKFSIFNSPLSEEEITQLSRTVNMLNRFEGMPGFEWVDELNAHLQYTINTSVTPVVSFDENKLLRGMKYFTPLFRYITEKRVLRITYHTYKDERILVETLHPYYLKQYNKRWFLLGLNDNRGIITNVALDRITDIEKVDTKFIPNNDIDFESYFNNIIGVSFLKGTEVEEIKLHVTKALYPYIASKPIHQSQEVVEKHEDGSVDMTINVMPNYELFQTLLSHGAGITVLSPEHVRNEIYKKIEENFKNYQ